MTACLDSWAVLAWLDGVEPAAGRVDALIDRQSVMSWINAAEVYYRVFRDHGASEADLVIAQLVARLTMDEATPTRVVQAARVKAVHPIALDDCFAVATATAYGTVLMTGDPEIIEADGLGCEVIDLR